MRGKEEAWREQGTVWVTLHGLQRPTTKPVVSGEELGARKVQVASCLLSLLAAGRVQTGSGSARRPAPRQLPGAGGTRKRRAQGRCSQRWRFLTGGCPSSPGSLSLPGGCCCSLRISAAAGHGGGAQQGVPSAPHQVPILPCSSISPQAQAFSEFRDALALPSFPAPPQIWPLSSPQSPLAP